MKDYPWPAVCAEEPGWEIPRELAHIIGVIVINWNWCEFIQACLLGKLLATDGRIKAKIIDPMGNRQRSDLFLGLIDERPLSEEAKDHLEHFQKCFSIGLENRNLIVHARTVAETDGPQMTAHKSHRKITSRHIPVDVELLVGVAKELDDACNYGADLQDAIFPPKPSPFPEKLPLPNRLTQLLPAQIIERYQPQSFDE